MYLRVCCVLVYAESEYTRTCCVDYLSRVYSYLSLAVNGCVCLLSNIVGAGSVVLCHRYSCRVVGHLISYNLKCSSFSNKH